MNRVVFSPNIYLVNKLLIWAEDKKINPSVITGYMETLGAGMTGYPHSTLENWRATKQKVRSPEAVFLYIEYLQHGMSKCNLTNKPHCIYNLDETGLQPEHMPPNVIAPPKSKPEPIVSPRSTTTTLIVCVNAFWNDFLLSSY